MKTRIGLGLLLLAALGVGLRAEISYGDTYQKVITEKGQPSGKMEAGDSLILRYPDETIRLKAGKVVSVDAAKNRPTIQPKAAAPTPPPAPAPEPVASATPASATSAKAVWMTDYSAALSTARSQNRRVFAFFTGSDWCVWCMRLQKEILTTPEFASYASENLILLELDFPQNKRQPAPLKKQNEQLAARFKIEGYPTVIVLDANGKTVGKLGYQPGGPAPFVKQLKSL
jgi:thiol-disulfide isomerase/thioredoxin